MTEQTLKLNKIGEHGLGKHLILLNSGYELKNELMLKDSFGSGYKVHYFHIDLNEKEEDVSLKLINTLNYYYYSRNMILDYSSFLLFLKYIHRISPSYSIYENVLILDPVNHKSNRTIKNIVSKKAKHLNFYKEEVKVPKYLNLKEFVDKVNYFKSYNMKILGYNDKSHAFKLSSILDNAKFEQCKTIDEVQLKISSNFIIH